MSDLSCLRILRNREQSGRKFTAGTPAFCKTAKNIWRSRDAGKKSKPSKVALSSHKLARVRSHAPQTNGDQAQEPQCLSVRDRWRTGSRRECRRSGRSCSRKRCLNALFNQESSVPVSVAPNRESLALTSEDPVYLKSRTRVLEDLVHAAVVIDSS